MEEARLLAGVVQTDTHLRLQVAEELVEYFKGGEHSPEDFTEMERLVTGLAGWMTSSNSKISVSAMEILGLLVQQMREKFKPYIPSIFPALKERLGDAKEQVREQSQMLIQQVLRDVVSAPQVFFDKLLESTLTHKNWRVREQGLLCLTRTLNYFGSGQISVSRHMNTMCDLLGDANSQVRSQALETVGEVYQHVGVKVRIDISRRGLPSARMAQLNAKFDGIDKATNMVRSDTEEVDDAGSSCSSNASAHTHGSARSLGARSRGSAAGRPPSVASVSRSSGAVTTDYFEKAFTDVPSVNIFTPNDLEKAVSSLEAIIGDPRKSWDARCNALKELRAVAAVESIDHQQFLALLKKMESAMVTSLKDLRSQVTRESCVTLAYLCEVLGSDLAHFAEQMMPQLIALLPNSAKVMATSAEVCIKFIIKDTRTHRLFQPLLSLGLSSKSPITRRSCAEFVMLILQSWDTAVLERSCPQIEEALMKGISDADAAARRQVRRAFWAYHHHFPASTNAMLEKLDPQLQKHLYEEKASLQHEANPAALLRPPPSASLRPSKRKPPPFKTTENMAVAGGGHPISPTHSFPLGSSIQVQRTSPSRVRRQITAAKALRGAKSVENLEDLPPRSPSHRPPSRSGARGGLRPQSRSGLAKKSEFHPGRAQGRISRSAQPSPSHSRETSPTGSHRVGSLPRRVQPLSSDPMLSLKLNKFMCGDTDDDNGSVTSERSTFSFASEVSVSPYTRFPNPITDLNELVELCSSHQWSERRDGMSQLHLLLDSSRPFSHAEIQMVKLVFRRMLNEPHAKVYGMFLETLSRFIEEHREHLDDWLFLLLLRLLHRQGTDMLSSLHYKLTMVLEHIRRYFDSYQQFTTLCRVLTDKTQPMNTKVKLAWLEYMTELLPQLDSSQFHDTADIRPAMRQLIVFTGEPKSVDIRKASQKALYSLFELNPATFTLMLGNMDKGQQETANRIIKGYMQEAASSGDEAEPPPVSPATPSGRRSRSDLRTPTGRNSRIPAPSPSRGTPLRSTPSTPRSATQSLTPSSSRNVGGTRSISASTPDMSATTQSLRYGFQHSRIPTPRRTPPMPRATSTTPYSTPRTVKRREAPPRAMSVDPDKMAQGMSLRRPTSARSNYKNYNPFRYQNGEDTPKERSPESFSFSDLPHLDFGSPDDNEALVSTKDHISVVLGELQTASSSKLRHTALQSLHSLAREHPTMCHWEEHFKPTLLKLVETVADEDTGVRTMSLRVLREMLKSESGRLPDFAELITMKVLKAFADPEASVSQAAEDLFPLLAPALPSESAMELLAPMALKEKYPLLLGVIKLLTKVVGLTETGCLEGKLQDMIPGVIRGYSHSESSVRKASVFCLVAIYSVVGDRLREHLTRLSSSQTKLLDLYIKRHQQSSAQAKTANGPRQ